MRAFYFFTSVCNITILTSTLFCHIPVYGQFPATPYVKYPLNNNATDLGPLGLNGTLSGTTGAVSRFGKSNEALAFTAGTSTGTLPKALVTGLQNDFTIGFWFKTGMTAPTGSNWFNGSSLVDAEVANVTNDWGIGLIDGGKVCFGIGNTDITIKTASANYNNGVWHFVVATRNRNTGMVTFYVDNTLIGSRFGNTNQLSAPAVIGLGRNSAIATGSYTGLLDDLIVYDRVLNPMEIDRLYDSLLIVSLPLKWNFINGTPVGNKINLSWQVEQLDTNEPFEIEYSSDGSLFKTAGKVEVAAGVTDGLQSRYQFSFIQPEGNTWYVRVKQPEADGQYNYSKILRLTGATQQRQAFYLLGNPVTSDLVIANTYQATIYALKVSDVNGRTLLYKAISNNQSLYQLQVSLLPPGYYVLSVEGHTQKLIPFIKQ